MKLCFRQAATALIAWLFLIAPATVGAPPALEFETASVKVHPMAPGAYMIKTYPHAPPFVIPTSNIFTDTAHVQDLVMEAYGLSEFQILYLPPFALSRAGIVYDIEGKAKGDATPTPAQLQQMLQALLADRFHLKTHWETKPKFSEYALVIDKKEPKFHESSQEGTTLFALARFLNQHFDAPVVDRTGLPAAPYDFDVEKMVDFREIDREEETDSLGAEDYLRTAVQHQLGLRMDLRKESTQVLVIDHIEEPSPH